MILFGSLGCDPLFYSDLHFCTFCGHVVGSRDYINYKVTKFSDTSLEPFFITPRKWSTMIISSSLTSSDDHLILNGVTITLNGNSVIKNSKKDSVAWILGIPSYKINFYRAEMSLSDIISKKKLSTLMSGQFPVDPENLSH